MIWSIFRVHSEKVTFHPNEIAFVTLDGSDKMTLRVTLEELPMNDVNVFASINDHKLIGLCLAYPRACPGSRPERDQFKRLATLTDKQGKIDMNLAPQRPKTLPFRP